MEVKRLMTIDPGFSGAIVIKEVGSFDPVDINCFVMPILLEKYKKDGKERKRNSLDRQHITTIIKTSKPDLVMIEKVASRPGQGAPATFRFGEEFGILQGICWGLEIPVGLIAPQAWQNRILVGHYRKRPGEDVKKAVERLVKDTFDVSTYMDGAKSLKPHDGVIDALGIALAIEKS